MQDLRAEAKDIFFRVKERKSRPKALKELKKELNHTLTFMRLMKNFTVDNTSTDAPFSESELKDYVDMYNETEVTIVDILL